MTLAATGLNIIGFTVTDPFKLLTAVIAPVDNSEVGYLRILSMGEKAMTECEFRNGALVCIPSNAGRKLIMGSMDYLIIKPDAVYGVVDEVEDPEGAAETVQRVIKAIDG